MKKIIALLLSVLMLLSIAPVAFAETAVDETTTVAAEDTEASDSDLSAAGDLFGGFFERIGDMLRIIFDFLANLFNGTGSDNIDNL